MYRLDEKFFNVDEEARRGDLTALLSEGEKILWRGKPKKSAYILNSVFRMLPFALIWLLFDGGFIAMLCIAGPELPLGIRIGLVVFFAFHLLPVWMWITNIVTANRQHKNLEYEFTDRRIILKSGIVGIDYKNIFYADIVSVNLRVGLIDRLCKVGDIYIVSRENSSVLYDLSECYFLLKKLQEIVLDLKMDASFPNDLRPATNKGFSTRYTKE